MTPDQIGNVAFVLFILVVGVSYYRHIKEKDEDDWK